LDYVWIETEVYDKNNLYQYTTSLYHAVLMLTGNDVGPRGSFQLAFVALMLLTGAIINANIFGNMAVILQSLNKKSTNFQEKLDIANETMKNLNIPMKLQEEVKNYFTFTQNTLDHQQELDEFLKTLSPSLRQKIISSIFSEVININPVFNNNKAAISHILLSLETKLFYPEDQIITQGDHPDFVYFISRGECDISVFTEKQKEIYVSTIREGAYFGEVALLKNCKRTASVFSKNYTTLAQVDCIAFRDIIQEFPSIKASMETTIREKYKDPWKKFQKKSIHNIDYFSYGISDEIIEEI
jgi:hypothetical protein